MVIREGMLQEFTSYAGNQPGTTGKMLVIENEVGSYAPLVETSSSRLDLI